MLEKIIKNLKPDILFEVIGQSDGISKKLVENALKNKIHVITPNKALIAKHGDQLASLKLRDLVDRLFESLNHDTIFDQIEPQRINHGCGVSKELIVHQRPSIEASTSI